MRILPRPLTTVLSDAMTVLSKIWRRLAPTAMVAFVPASVLTLLIFGWTGVTDFLEAVLDDPGYLQNIPEEEYNEIVRSLLIGGSLAAVINGIVTVYVFLFANHLVRASLKDIETSASEARRHAGGKLFSGLLAGLLAGLMVVGAFVVGALVWAVLTAQAFFTNQTVLALFVFGVVMTPAVWLAVSVSMYTSVVSFEDRNPTGSLRRSIELVKGRWVPTLMFLIMVSLFGAIAIQLIQLVALPLSIGTSSTIFSWVMALVGIAAQGLIVAAMGATYTGWYIDLRARREPVLIDQL